MLKKVEFECISQKCGRGCCLSINYCEDISVHNLPTDCAMNSVELNVNSNEDLGVHWCIKSIEDNSA